MGRTIMLTAETKRRIDACRNVLVGKLPLPTDQVELITLALIYKFMDDLDEESVQLGGKRSFFTGSLEQYRWRSLLPQTVSADTRLTLFADGIEALGSNEKAAHLPALFRDIFRNAFLKFRDGRILTLFLNEVNGFAYSHSEELGNAFEYLLQCMGTQGENGQFRTPRHIIDFIVACLDPKPGETILDPACGTGGFLVSAYKHILAKHTSSQSTIPGDKLTHAQRQKVYGSVTGYDITDLMVKLSKVNLFLHGFPDPGIHIYDTLSNDARWNEKADLILANPPFMTPKGGVTPHSRFGVASRKAEVLFLDYILEHLSSTGRGAVVVPEGIMFVEQGAQAKLRRMLVDEGLLFASISLPHGVFKPYASVKTHILLIDKELASRAQEILFVEIENDGYTQSDTRLPVDGNQLPRALETVAAFCEAARAGVPWNQRSDNPLAFAVSKRVIARDAERNLLGRWYDLSNRVSRRPGIPLKRLGDLCSVKDGLSPNMATPPGEFELVVPAEERKTADRWDFEGNAVCVPLVSSAGHGKADIKRLHYQEGRFALATTMCALFSNSETELLPRYLLVLLTRLRYEILVPLMCGATNVTMRSDQLLDLMIPLPPLDRQQEIVETHLAKEHAAQFEHLATSLKRSSANPEFQRLADQIFSAAEALYATAEKSADVDSILADHQVANCKK
jgi:type I restriction-modification system DNA methylase subunit